MKYKRIYAAAAMLLIFSAIIGCGNSTDKAVSKETANSVEHETSDAADYSKIKVGVISTPGKDDGGWCQATYECIMEAAGNMGMSEEQIVFVDNVPEEISEVSNVISRLVNDGCTMILSAAAGYKDAIDAAGKEYPEIQFIQFEGNVTDNVIEYGIRDYQAMFVCGYISALMSENDDLGFCGGYPTSSVIRSINAYAQGAKYANPNAKVRIVFANSWFDPAAEKECANSLIAAGVTCMGISTSSPSIPQTCQEAGVYCTGYQVDMHDYAPEAIMVSFMWNWTPIFEEIITQSAKNDLKPYGENYLWGVEHDCAQLSEINSAIVPKEISDKAEEVQAKILSGEIDVFAGEIKDNNGNIIVPDGETMPDERILDIGCLFDNVIGTIPE